jgi:hypothetical protein
MADYTNDQLAALSLQTTNLIGDFTNALFNWANGVYNGGPNGDGLYPLPVALGATKLVPCIDRIRVDATKLKVKNIQLGVTAGYTASGVNITMLPTDTDTLFILWGSTASTVVNVILPDTLPVGWVASFIQFNTGNLRFSTNGQGVIRNRQSFDRTAGQGALAVAVVESKFTSGAGGATITLGGDLKSA